MIVTDYIINSSEIFDDNWVMGKYLTIMSLVVEYHDR